VGFYREHGYLVVRGLFAPAEMALASMEADRLLGRQDLIHTDNIRCRWQNHVVSGECLFETFDPFIDLPPCFASLARDPPPTASAGPGLWGPSAASRPTCSRTN